MYMRRYDLDGSAPAKGLGLSSEIICVMREGRLEVTTLLLQTEVRAPLAWAFKVQG